MWRPLDNESSLPLLMVRLLQERLDRRQDFLNDDLNPLGVRVQPVRLVELGVARDAVKEEGIERYAVRLRQGRIDGGKLPRIFAAEVGSRPHAREENRQMGGAGL